MFMQKCNNISKFLRKKIPRNKDLLNVLINWNKVWWLIFEKRVSIRKTLYFAPTLASFQNNNCHAIMRVRNYLPLEYWNSKIAVNNLSVKYFISLKNIFKHIQNLVELIFRSRGLLKTLWNILKHFAKISNGYNYFCKNVLL